MPARWRLGVLLGAWCALRSGEVRELRRGDIDPKRGTIRVSRGVVRAGTITYLGPPKTDAATRTVQIPASLIDDVTTHLRDHAQLVLTVSCSGAPTDATPTTVPGAEHDSPRARPLAWTASVSTTFAMWASPTQQWPEPPC